MGLKNSKSLAYYEPDGNLITYKSNKKHNGKAEFLFVSSHDGGFKAGDECYLIHSPWMDHWVNFIQAAHAPPGFISNSQLCDITGEEPEIVIRMKKGMKPKSDFRPINKVVWRYLFELYGGGPVLFLYVPSGLPEKSYNSGSWVNKFDFEDFVQLVKFQLFSSSIFI